MCLSPAELTVYFLMNTESFVKTGLGLESVMIISDFVRLSWSTGSYFTDKEANIA